MKMYLQRKRAGLIALLSLIISLGSTYEVHAQAPTISYPVAAQDLTRGYSQGNLTVKLVFNGICTGTTTAKIALPASVTYIAGSVSKTAGTVGLSIAESSIADPSNPVFNISGISAIGDNITFTVARSAACGSLATAKDTVYVFTSGGCSNGSELVGTMNTYNLLSPSLAITPPAALTNAVVGTTATRTTTITNGGNGLLDTLRYYVVYPGGGIINTSGTNAITANGTSFAPSSTSGDTLFYKIFGATLFGGNNLLSNGETVIIAEPIKVMKCNTATAYGAGWGKTKATQCQIATGTSTVTMRTGVTSGSVVVTRLTNLLPCSPGVLKITYSGTGTGDTSGAIYNVNPGFGRSDGGNIAFYASGSNLTYVNFSNYLLNGTIPITPTYSGSTGRFKFTLNFTTDPDGAGLGLEDLDGDGFYDDLLPGQSFYIQATQTLTFPPECDNAGAGISTIVMGDIYYKGMCSATTDSTRKVHTLTGPNLPTPNLSVVKPGVVYGGQPFTIRTCAEMAGNQNFADYSTSADSMVYEIQLPAGVTYVAGSAKYNNTVGVTTPTITLTASTLQIRKNGRESFCLDYDLVYACGASGAMNIPSKIYFVHDRSCGALQYYKCDTIKIAAVCPLPCTLTTGVNNIAPSKVVRTHYGWTDTTMSTPVDTATLSAVSKKTAILYDTINVKQSAKQIGSANNLFYTALIDRVGATNMFNFAGGAIYYKPVGSAVVSCALPTPTATVVGTQTKYLWKLTGLSCLPATFNNDDSMWVDMNYVLINAPSMDALTQPATNAYFYDTVSSAESKCGSWPLDVYVIGMELVNIGNNSNTATTFSGCASSTAFIRTAKNVSNSVFDNFPNEFRPSVMKDSIIVTLPEGYSWTGGSCTLQYESFGTTLQVVTLKNISVTPLVAGQQLIFKNPGTWPMSDVALRGNRGYDLLSIPLTANCEATTGTQAIGVRETGVRYFYTGAGQPYATENNAGGGNLSLSFANKPTLTVQNNTGTVQGVLPQHYWDVKISNSSLVLAPNLWFALEKPATSGIIIDSVKRRTGSTPTTTLPLTATYGATGNNWYKVSTGGLASGVDSFYRIYFRYTNCTKDSIALKAGWNCTGYPSADPTAYACTAAQTYLIVDPQPSQVQLNVARQPGGGSSINLCTADSALLIVNSAQAANLVNPYVIFYPPAGVTMGSAIQVEYPLGSGNYQNTAITSVAGGGYKIDLTAHTAIGTSGMLGTASANPLFTPLGGDRQAKIKLDFTTSCGFSSGSSFAFSAYGNKPCGSPATGNGVTATTAALNITGVTVSGSAGVNMSFGSAISASCGTTIPVSMTTTPTSVGTAAGDTMVYTLPAGLAYAGGLTSGFTADTSGTGGATIVKIAMPEGVAANTPINYSFNVVPNGGGCGNSTITGAYKRAIAPLSCGGTPCANSSVIIASATSPAITINKPALTITNITMVSGRFAPGGTVVMSVSVNNGGTINAPASSYMVEGFCGSSTTPFSLGYFPPAIAAGGSATATMSFTVPASGSGCVIGATTTYMIRPVTAVGTLQCMCSQTSFTPAMALPITFITTDVSADNCAANIAWTYSINKGSALEHFVIERSTDGAHFTPVATLAADAVNYIDVTPYSGNWQYRIGAVEASGTVTYSHTLSVKTIHCSANKIQVYPNPASSKVQIVLQGSVAGNSFELLDALGRVVLKGNLQGNSNNTVDVSRIAPGVYTLKLISEEGIQTERLHIK